jgi:hypothetical protein
MAPLEIPGGGHMVNDRHARRQQFAPNVPTALTREW